MNKLKVAGLRMILVEKRLSTDEVVDRYPNVWDTIWFHMFERFTQSRGYYIRPCVWELYTYEKLVPRGKKKASPFAPVDHVVVHVPWIKPRVQIEKNDLNVVARLIIEQEMAMRDK
ncbi:hypothetical protein MTR67_052293 [Solanum verrucosum]|uniref:Uncharacterized protein n=1 Tax=Solanum verrucosum TaxID=315347 RepID=A0AAF1A2R9_SOLVR|nr:hypothetical protein MTR67_052293 [Solanum verrucosum]